MHMAHGSIDDDGSIGGVASIGGDDGIVGVALRFLCIFLCCFSSC